MVDKMIELIPQESHDFRIVWPKEFAKKCKDYLKSQYELKTDEVEPSKK